MTVAIVQFGGSNCDRDALRALSHLGIDAKLTWHEHSLPRDVSGIVIPGGFSYGDYLRAGAMAAHSPIMAEVRDHAASGVPVLGVCNGAQVGCESGLTPGAFTTNSSAQFQCESVYLRVENADTPWTTAYDVGEVIEIPIAHGEGRFEIPASECATLSDQNRILFRYCSEDGEITEAANPNGSRDNIAGMIGNQSNIAVLMPHPERATLSYLGRSTDGQGILQALGK
jgi:phosphoribosylformylglycinamidine synthase I